MCYNINQGGMREMMICPKCHNVMNHVFRFTPERNCELDICKNCYFETKPKRLKFSSIEIMQDNTKDKINHKVKKKVKKKNGAPKNKTNKSKRKKGKKK